MATIAQIKDKLPNVKVQYKGKTYVGYVSGRKNRFATIHFSDRSADWSWESVARAYNNKSALRA